MSDGLPAQTRGDNEPMEGFAVWLAGRARRREYWLLTTPLLAADFAIGFASFNASIVVIVLGLILWLIQVRRFHDLGWTGFSVVGFTIAIGLLKFASKATLSAELAVAVPTFAGLAYHVAMGTIPGQPRSNRYGPPPGRPDLAETFG